MLTTDTTRADVRTPAVVTTITVPAIGQPWPAGGTYAGISRGRDGEAKARRDPELAPRPAVSPLPSRP